MHGLDGKVIVVAGGASGIGRATALRLAEEGGNVVVGDLNRQGAEDTAEEIRESGGDAQAFEFDIGHESACNDLIAFAVETFGHLDGLFNVAADLSPRTLGSDTDLLDVDVNVWQRTLDINLTGYFYTMRAALPELIRRGRGSIVNTLSGLVFYGDPSRPSYGASKGGLLALTRHVAARWGKEGIRCNAVAPGLVLTEQVERNVSAEEVDAVLGKLRSPRLGRPEDIAAMVAFLLSDDAEWINGQMHLVNGGRVG